MALINLIMRQEEWREAKAVIYKKKSVVIMEVRTKWSFLWLANVHVFVCVQTGLQSDLVSVLIQRQRVPLSKVPLLWNCLYSTGEQHRLAVNARPTLIRNTETEVEQIRSVGPVLSYICQELRFPFLEEITMWGEM